MFVEVVQRIGGYRGSGALNAPVRMARIGGAAWPRDPDGYPSRVG